MSYFDIHHGSFWRRRGDQPLLYMRRLKTLERAIGKPGRLLDIGCGEGFFASRAQSRGWLVTAIDSLDEGVTATRRRLRLGTVMSCDAEELPFADGSFDAISAWDVLEHLPTPARALAEARRVLRLGGVLSFSTPNTSARSVRCRGQDSIQFSDATHVSLLDRDEWTGVFGEHGFRIEELGTDAYWDTPYPGTRIPSVFYKLHAQLAFASRFTNPSRMDGENLVGLLRRID